MKRALSLVLIAAMMLSCVPAMAAEINTNTSQSGNTVVQYGADESYIVTVPDSARIDAEGLGNINVSVSNAMLASNATLKVYITGDSYANGYWYLNSRDNATNKLQYTISKNSVELGANGEVLSVDAGQAWNSTVTAELKLQLEAEVSQAGIYSDTLTFVVDYQKEANLQLNEYGFYYGQPYTAQVDIDDAEFGMITLELIAYPTGHLLVWTQHTGYNKVMMVPATDTEYSDHCITALGTEITVSSDGTVLTATDGDVTRTLTMQAVSNANPAHGVFTNNITTPESQIVYDESHLTVYYQGNFDAEFDAGALSFEEGLVYIGNELLGVYYPDGSKIAPINESIDGLPGGSVYIREKTETIDRGMYYVRTDYTNIDTAWLKVTAEEEAALHEVASNWNSNEAQLVLENLSNKYGFDITPTTIVGTTTMVRSSVVLEIEDYFQDSEGYNTSQFFIMKMQANGLTRYSVLGVLVGLTYNLTSFGIPEDVYMPQNITDAFKTQYVKFSETPVSPQVLYADAANEFTQFIFFEEGMTWGEWHESGYAEFLTSGSSPRIRVHNGYMYLCTTSPDAQSPIYYNGQHVSASDTMVTHGEYAALKTFTVDGVEISTLSATWSDFCISADNILNLTRIYQNYGYCLQITKDGRTGLLKNSNGHTQIGSYIVPGETYTIQWNN